MIINFITNHPYISIAIFDIIAIITIKTYAEIGEDIGEILWEQ